MGPPPLSPGLPAARPAHPQSAQPCRPPSRDTLAPAAYPTGRLRKEQRQQRWSGLGDQRLSHHTESTRDAAMGEGTGGPFQSYHVESTTPHPGVSP